MLNGVDAETPVGFVPGGGASVLPRALGLSRNPVEAARRLAAGAQPRRIAVGRVNGHRFGFACGIGLDAEVVRAVDELGRREDGRRPGNLAFAWTGVRTLTRRRFRAEPALEVKGFGRAAFAFVSNGPTYTYAGRVAVRPTPEATFEGGLDLVAPVRMRARDLPRLAWYARGRGDRAAADDLVYVHDADRIEIVCDRPLPLEADGEDLGDAETRAPRGRARRGDGARLSYEAGAGCERRCSRTPSVATTSAPSAASSATTGHGNDLVSVRLPAGSRGSPASRSTRVSSAEPTYQPPRVLSVSKNGWPGSMYVTGSVAYGYRSWTIRSGLPAGPGTRYVDRVPRAEISGGRIAGHGGRRLAERRGEEAGGLGELHDGNAGRHLGTGLAGSDRDGRVEARSRDRGLARALGEGK